jgi:MSHA biogenesis protein MshG
VAEYYEDQANLMIKNFSTLIEPILLFVLGGMVLLLALGVFMPVWDMVHVVQ